MSRLPAAVARYRDQYRAEEIPTGYRGWTHFAFTFGVGTAALLWSALEVSDPSALEWLTVPLTFLYANLSEYWGHRTAMHRPLPGLGLVYRRHAGQHHRFFTHEAMPLESSSDFRAVLFPPSLALFFFLAFALPAWWLLSLLASDNAGWLFVATAIAYFLNYELFHLAYHAPAGHWATRLPGFARLQRLHRIHHDPSLMARCNFNITYPIGDLLFGTLHRGPRAP
jgi:hypothetical protein